MANSSRTYRVLAGGTFGRIRHKDTVHVSADELERASEAARQRFERMLPNCVTSFYLPPVQHVEERQEINPAVDDDEVRRVKLALASIPFPCLRICQTVLNVNEPPMDTQVICFNGASPKHTLGTGFGWMSRDHQIGTGLTLYTPTGIAPEVDNSLPMSYLNLMEILSNNSARYIKQPVSRQVRRASGFADGYDEYIVIRKPTKEQRKSAMRLSEIMRRHPRLHAVRGHLRHYRTGLVVPVAPHVRGVGDMTQAKDYYSEEGFYTEG